MSGSQAPIFLIGQAVIETLPVSGVTYARQLVKTSFDASIDRYGGKIRQPSSVVGFQGSDNVKSNATKSTGEI